MMPKTRFPNNPLNSASGGAVGIVIALVLVLALAGGGGYLAYGKYYKKAQLRTKLSSMKMKAELIRFTHDSVSTGPLLFAPICQNLAKNKLINQHSRLAVEKPLGRAKEPISC